MPVLSVAVAHGEIVDVGNRPFGAVGHLGGDSRRHINAPVGGEEDFFLFHPDSLQNNLGYEWASFGVVIEVQCLQAAFQVTWPFHFGAVVGLTPTPSPG